MTGNDDAHRKTIEAIRDEAAHAFDACLLAVAAAREEQREACALALDEIAAYPDGERIMLDEEHALRAIRATPLASEPLRERIRELEAELSMVRAGRDALEASDECGVDGIPPCHAKPNATEADWCRMCLVARYRQLRRAETTLHDRNGALVRDHDAMFKTRVAMQADLAAANEKVRTLTEEATRQLGSAIRHKNAKDVAEQLVIDQRDVLLTMKRERDEARAACAARDEALEHARCALRGSKYDTDIIEKALAAPGAELLAAHKAERHALAMAVAREAFGAGIVYGMEFHQVDTLTADEETAKMKALVAEVEAAHHG